MAKNLLYILLLLISASGCKGEVERNLIRTIEQQGEHHLKVRCHVALKEVTPFAWDKLYFFGAWTTTAAIADATGLAYQGTDVPDDYRRMLFIQRGKVVHEEDYKPFDYHTSTIDFPDLIDSLSHAKAPFLTPATAQFVADKSKIEQSCTDCFFYSLSASPVVH